MRSTRLPPLRLTNLNERPPRPEGEWVVYWMIAARRAGWSFALERAVELAERLRRPLVVLEALRVDYPWASDRLHRFVLDGMVENARRFAGRALVYHPYVEPAPGEGSGLVQALAERASAVVTDDFPGFFLPRMVAAVARRSPASFEVVDGNGLLPLRAAESAFSSAYSFRRFLQRQLRPHLAEFPEPDPTADLELPRLGELPPEIAVRWPAAGARLLAGDPAALASLPIDHEVAPTGEQGGSAAAEAALARFLERRLARYASERNVPDHDVGSGLSPYLHFGQISVHEVFTRLMSRLGWSAEDLAKSATGQREGWGGVEPNAEAFLDELVTWRELGYQFCAKREDYDRYESLPEWALATLARHAGDERPHLYSLEELAAAETHDPLWNAAQRQLRAEGRIHNYLRMLWGKKILEWSPSPREALARMVELNNRWALDGRNPNSYTGIFWCLGRFDRPWGPERPIFGTVRYMSSENTARKVSVREYLRRFGPEAELFA
ncbi:MAG TPA: deoxyribodipyrimidine photolyase [Thermoanaerobaculia bacterium]|nr:deoxyribodipyrimidine photolyase [Thermoanaerobaculia bacterium]